VFQVVVQPVVVDLLVACEYVVFQDVVQDVDLEVLLLVDTDVDLDVVQAVVVDLLVDQVVVQLVLLVVDLDVVLVAILYPFYICLRLYYTAESQNSKQISSSAFAATTMSFDCA